MRKSNNYYKFMEYVSCGQAHENTVCKDNGVLECTSYVTVSNIEDYEHTTIGVKNCWLTIKNVLVNEDVVNVYYVRGERTFYIASFILDNYKTQKEIKSDIHKAVYKFFINNVEIIEDTEAEEIEEVEETETSEAEETTTRGTMETLPHVDCSNLKKVPKNCLYGMFGGFPSISEMYNDKCFCCIADRKGNECKGKETCGKTWKRYEAIIKPEWHHVSLATLANLDFDMLDKKRQVYLKAHRELKRTLADLSKCKSGHTYEARARKFMSDMISQYYDNEISYAMRKYLDLQLSMSNVTNGVWSSYVEPAMGLHESRRYSRPTLKY